MIPLPCPFCGLEWHWDRQHQALKAMAAAKARHWQEPASLFLIEEKGVTSIYCPHCHVTGPGVSKTNFGRGPQAIWDPWPGFSGFPRLTDDYCNTEAIRLWNTRTEDPHVRPRS